ncbi:hypothetical protein GGR56DRAFT_684038 [Xylariaceae sp. FL0804]|nr:hypothetical protein GGR56DRAFT_684038 [Xylariaceae sp. FL0804]
MATAEVLNPTWATTDDESLSLIINLLMEDVRAIGSAIKGKQVEGDMSDMDLALQLCAEDLDRASLFASDRRMTRSIQGAVQADAEVLLQAEREERMAHNDREISASLQQGQSAPANQNTEAERAEEDLEMWEKMSALFIEGINDDEAAEYSDVETVATEAGGQPESSTWAAARPQKTKRSRRQCQACCDVKHFTDLARAPCHHEYCRECLARLFQDAMTDESLFPPRCCQQAIPLERNQIFLTRDLIHKFRAKAVELSTPNRTYCHRPTCSAFIHPSSIRNGMAHCGVCEAQTCTTCKGAAHHGDCPFDESLQQVLQLAQEERWQRCPRCFTMIELHTGCFHMTCKCGFQFCYLCVAPWKRCECRQWDEHRLYDRAEEIYRRDHPLNEAPAHHAPARGRAEADIGRIMDHLRVNHECQHRSWSLREGRERCEGCRDLLPWYIYQCDQCHTRACARCRFNRL